MGKSSTAPPPGSLTTTPDSFPVTTPVSLLLATPDFLLLAAPYSLQLLTPDSLPLATSDLLPKAKPDSLPTPTPDSLPMPTPDFLPTPDSMHMSTPDYMPTPDSLPTPTPDSLLLTPTAQDSFASTTPDIFVPTITLVVSLATPDSLSKTSFAGKAKGLQSYRNDWIVIERNKKKIILTGSGESSVLKGVAKTRKNYLEIGISCLKLGLSSDLVKTHLQGQKIEVKEVFVFPSKIKGTVLAKVRVALEHKARALDATTWPEHVRVSSWTNKYKEQRQDDARKRHQTKV